MANQIEMPNTEQVAEWRKHPVTARFLKESRNFQEHALKMLLIRCSKSTDPEVRGAWAVYDQAQGVLEDLHAVGDKEKNDAE